MKKVWKFLKTLSKSYFTIFEEGDALPTSIVILAVIFLIISVVVAIVQKSWIPFIGWNFIIIFTALMGIVEFAKAIETNFKN